MLAKYFSIIRSYVLSVYSQRKYNFYHQNTLLDAFGTKSRNIIGRNPPMEIPLLANQDLTPMLVIVARALGPTCICRGAQYGSGRGTTNELGKKYSRTLSAI